MKLHSVEIPADILYGTDRGVGGPGNNFKSYRHTGNMVTMTHPDLTGTIDKETVKKRPRLSDRQQLCMAEFTLAGRHDLTAEMAAHQLHAVADAKHRHSKLEQFLCN